MSFMKKGRGYLPTLVLINRQYIRAPEGQFDHITFIFNPFILRTNYNFRNNYKSLTIHICIHAILLRALIFSSRQFISLIPHVE